jgi:hypothetical protein
MADAKRKGRMSQRRRLGISNNAGKQNGQAKLTDEQIFGIRKIAGFGINRRKVASLYGGQHQHISRIMREERRAIC